MTWLLALYPRAWRRRYGAEIEELVASQPKSFQLGVDLLGGAIDAHWKPQAFAQRMERVTSAKPGGSDMIHRLTSCRSTAQMSPKDRRLSAVLTIGGSMVVAASLFIWESPTFETFALVMLPGVWHLATQPFYLRGHSTRAKVVLLGGPLVGLAAIASATLYLNNVH